MAIGGCGASLFGPGGQQYIKIQGGDFVAIQGSNVMERLITSDLRIPYKQVLKGRLILKAGQENYLLNHLGLGDNATFVALRTSFNPKSVIEADNYIQYNYYEDLVTNFYFKELLVLTGNSSHRIPQLYLTNPNTKYDVSIDVMIGVIDDTYNFFSDIVNQTGTTFFGLEYSDIKTHIIGETIVIFDKNTPPLPLIYLDLSDINSLEIAGKIVTVDDSSLGIITLQFLTENDAKQAHSILNYVLENPNIDINSLNPQADILDPVVYFYSNVGNSASYDYIAFNGATAGVPYNTSQGFTFSTSMSLSTWGSASVITPQILIDTLVDYISDNRDGTMSMSPNNIVISGTGSNQLSQIIAPGNYILTFSYFDIAGNQLDGVNLTLNITS
jgi:hypothetical protein